MTAPLSLSVVIPAFRAAGTIGRAVDSLLAQTRPPAEILVIDDGSPDDLGLALAPYGAAVTLIKQPNGGAASARNTGIGRAAGDVIAFLDADDTWEPTKAARQLEILERHPEVGMVASTFFWRMPGGDRRLRTPPLPAMQHPPAALDEPLRLRGRAAFRIATKVWTCTVAVRRAVLGDHRFFSGLEPAEDRDLWIRLIEAAPIYLLSEPLATYWVTPGSLSRASLEREMTGMLGVVRRSRAVLGAAGYRYWMGHTWYRWAAAEPSRGRALGQLLRSVGYWPLPFVPCDTAMPAARLRLALARLRSARPAAG